MVVSDGVAGCWVGDCVCALTIVAWARVPKDGVCGLRWWCGLRCGCCGFIGLSVRVLPPLISAYWQLSRVSSSSQAFTHLASICQRLACKQHSCTAPWADRSHPVPHRADRVQAPARPAVGRVMGCVSVCAAVARRLCVWFVSWVPRVLCAWSKAFGTS